MTTTVANTPAPLPGVVARVAAAADALGGVIDDVAGLSDDDVVLLAQRSAGLGRLVDALRVRAAGEIDARSDRGTCGRAEEERLSTQFGCSSATGVLEHATGASRRDAFAQIQLDRRTRAGMALTGQGVPARYPRVAEALRRGEMTREAAELLTRRLAWVENRRTVPTEEREAAERALVAAARRDATGGAPRDDAAEAADDAERLPETFDVWSVMVEQWMQFLDRDGVDPDAQEQYRRRSFTVGRERDGLVRVYGDVVPELAAGLNRLNAAYLKSPVGFADPASAADDAPWTDAESSDERTGPQKRHDILMAIVSTAARAAETPRLGGAAPTLMVSIEADQLDGGIARIDGSPVPLLASFAHRIACTGAVQKVVFSDTGRIIRLGSRERLFDRNQRRAIAVRDGECIIPGCRVPAAWCEIHHVEEHARGGETHTSNGVLLCWWHHHNLDRSGWRILMRHGTPYVSAPAWIDSSRRFRPVGRRSDRPRGAGPPG